MKELQFLDLILDGMTINTGELKNYFVRKQKEAEAKHFYTEKEFYQKCRDVLSLLHDRFEDQFWKKKEELIQTINVLKSKNEKFEPELNILNSLSKENFNIQLSDFTGAKYHGELWLSQIRLVHNCIDEIYNQNFKITFEINDLNIDRYLNYVFSQKSVSQKTKMDSIEASIQKRIDQKSSFEVEYDYVMNQLKYWKEPTRKEKENFQIKRAESFEESNTTYENFIKGSPKSIQILNREYESVILNRLSEEPYRNSTLDFIEGRLPQDLSLLAIIIGKIDFLKKLHAPKEIKISEKWHALLFWLELLTAGEKPPTNAEGNFIKTEIVLIGAKRCNSTGISFYNSFKNIEIKNKTSLIIMFGNKWKETVLELSNQNPHISKYIDDNY